MTVTATDDAAWYATARLVLAVAESTPGLSRPRIFPALAAFDYRYLPDAREAVAAAEAALADAFGVTFTGRTEIAGDGTPRSLREAVLPGMALVIISRAEHAGDRDSSEDTREMAAAA